MAGLMEDKSGCMISYALKVITFIVRDTSKERITVVQSRENGRSSKFVGRSSVSDKVINLLGWNFVRCCDLLE